MNLLRLLPSSLKDRLRTRAGVVTPDDRIRNLRQAGFAPRQIIDGGAFVGNWARVAREAFPSAGLLLVEPQPHLREPLTALCAQLGNARLASAGLGAIDGQSLEFLLEETNSRFAPPGYSGPSVKVPVRTIASLIAEHGFTSCDLLKLDLQGHELAALQGAGDWFGRIELILVEVTLLPIGQQLWFKELESYKTFPPLQAPETYNLTGILDEMKKAAHPSD